MYKRLSSILFPIMTLALLGAAVWGYQENQEKNTVMIKAENQYQRAFHDLSFHMDTLHTELGNAIAVNSTSQDFYRKGLINVWKISSQAQSEINQLPLGLLPFSETKELLDNISKFSYRTAVRDLTKKPLSDEEKETLNTLYTRSQDITDGLSGVQTKVLANSLRWMDVELALAQQKENMDNTIVDGFKAVDKKVGDYTEMNWGPAMASITQKRNIHALAGNESTPEEIKQKAAEFLGVADSAPFTVVENGNGTAYNSYSVTAIRPDTQQEVHMDFTKNGGQVILYMAPRTVTQKNIDIRRARDAAMEFLDGHGYDGMRPIDYDEYQNVMNFTFAKQDKDITIYPEKLNIKVAMDNGEIFGLQAMEYILEHKTRNLTAPSLTLEQAKKELNPKFELASHDQVLIKNDLDEEVVCYLFRGRINNSSYKIYINGDTGYEEKIEVIRQQNIQ